MSELPDEFFDENEYCVSRHISPRTAQRWRANGEGPPYIRLGPRRVIYRRADVEAYEAARTFRHNAEELAQALAAGAEKPKSGPLS